MKKVELNIIAISHSVTQTHNFAVVLGEIDGHRRLPIVIGGFEAQAIAVAMERIKPNRPLTHDLFKNSLETFDIKLKEIVINNLLDGIFYARLICEQNGKIFEIDSRTSDAIALAIRFKCPIYTFEFILEAAGVVLEDPNPARPKSKKRTKTPKPTEASLSSFPLKELNNLLNTAIEDENYERAALIRDEINRRKKQQG